MLVTSGQISPLSGSGQTAAPGTVIMRGVPHPLHRSSVPAAAADRATPAPGAAIRYGHADTPLGAVRLSRDDVGLTGLAFTDRSRGGRPGPTWRRDEASLEPVRRQLREYFEGERTQFELELHLLGSPFQVAVWSALRAIPFGESTSYGMIATRIGRPTAVRAVGAANGRNPVAIVVPCHRVIGADGTLTGYGGGLDRKAWLLDHERSRRQPALAI